jgi:protocatechuate 3,4-dioxygenase beta subunit
MTRIRPTALGLFALIILLAGPACGRQHAQRISPAVAGPPEQVYELRGAVVDATPDCSEERLARLGAVETEKDLGVVFREVFAQRPVPHVVVTARGEAVTREAVTDADGHFRFADVPRGEYEISAETPTPPSGTREKRIATGTMPVTLDANNRYVLLELRADRITVRGRITTAGGRPVASAKVIGIHEIDDPSCMHASQIVTTVSNPDGSYALQGLNPPDLWRTAGYLNGGDPTADSHSFYFVVRVEADDLVQRRENVPRFPLVTQERLELARRLLKAMNQVQTRLEGSSELHERENLGPFPASQGNTIRDIDVVLDPWPRAHVSGRVVETNGNPTPGRVLELSPVGDGSPHLSGDGYAPPRPVAFAVDERGAFDMASIFPGKYSVLVYRPSPIGGDRNMEQVPVAGQLLDVPPGARVEDFEIQVNPAADYAIAGHVRDAHGEPICGLFVGAKGDPHGRSWWTRTDAQGAYYIDGLDGVGLPFISVTFGYGGLAMIDVPLNAKNVDLIVPDRGSIRGVVRNAKTGEVITTCQVTVPMVGLPESGAVWENPHTEVEWKPDGGFMLSDVPAGQATVEVRCEELGTQRYVIPVEAGKTSSLECEMKGSLSS